MPDGPVSASLKVPFYTTFRRVTVPVCLPTILDISLYLFIKAMTTVSAIVFLFYPHTMTASILMLFQDDNGNLGSATAIGMIILLTTAGVRVLHWIATRGFEARTQAWRKKQQFPLSCIDSPHDRRFLIQGQRSL